MLDSWARLHVAKGDLDEMSRVMQEIRASHNPPALNAGAVMNQIAGELDHHGHPAKAREVRESLVSWLGRRPAAELNAGSLIALSTTLARLARCPEAVQLADSLYAAHPTIPATGNRGLVAAHCGRQAVADSMSRALSRSEEEKYSRGSHLMFQARIAAVQGRKEEAVDLLIDAIARGESARTMHIFAEFATLRGFKAYESAIKPRG